MAGCASEPLCQPCVYHGAFKGELLSVETASIDVQVLWKMNLRSFRSHTTLLESIVCTTHSDCCKHHTYSIYSVCVCVCVVSGATGEETSHACSPESRAGGPGDAVSVWTAGPPDQGTDAAGTSCPIFPHRGHMLLSCTITISWSESTCIFGYNHVTTSGERIPF